MRFHVITFGCQMNVHESDWISRALAARGWSVAAEDEALAIVVNTCSVRDKPEQKVYSLLGRLAPYAAADPRVFVAVGGCVAQQVGRGLLDRFPFVRLVFGTDQVHRVPETLDQLAEDPSLRLALLDFGHALAERAPVFDAGPQSYAPGQAYVSIMQGCDNFCTYCIVPFTRGRQKSRASGAVLDECRALAERGVREITLLGQNVNSYGRDKHGDGTTFAQLLRQVAAIPGLARLRFTTSHPRDLGPDVVAAFADLSVLCPSLHLPLQAGSDRVLKRMGRGYGLARYLDLVRDLRAARPDLALTTDLIVGFPGETEEEFAATLDAMRAANFESSFSFAYSDRPGARAERMEGKLDQAVKLERLARLQALQEELTARALAGRVGAVAEVLAEGESVKQDPAAPRSWRGRDAHGRVVNFAFPGPQPAPSLAANLAGALVEVRILEAKKHSLRGEAVGEPW
ncbi:MAG: tRNA (N6-isopentenyl adenosine(37)-C2)-methylthiotransferase MiaB [Thermodesulfobacteriota bacterium]